MSDGEVRNFSTLVPKEGNRDQVLELLKEGIEKTRKEDGCVNAAIFESIEENGGKIYVVGHWKDESSLKSHMGAEHFVQFKEKVKPLLDGFEVLKIKKTF